MKELYLLMSITALIASTAAPALAGPLEDYVNAPDPNYQYALAHTNPGPGYTIYDLDMTSQSWKEGLVTPHLWRHWLGICVPANAVTDTGMLVVSGGSNEHAEPPRGLPPEVITVAMATRSVIAMLQGVPNEPVQFADENRMRSEDEIIAYTFDRYLKTGDPTWPLLLPMVKSAVRAMDAVQDFGRNHPESPFNINRFVVTGASKRGWTTWLTGATDERVVAIAPMVIDMLNLPDQMAQQIAYYGHYTESTQDYTDFNLQDRFQEPNGQTLLDIVDPYQYLRRLTMPKLVLLGSGDQYWTVNASSLYYPALKGPKNLHYEPNTDHGLESRKGTIQALTAFYDAVIKGQSMPQFTWEFKPDGEFKVIPNDAPVRANLWIANAPTKDFRLMTIGPAWNAQPLALNAEGVYSGTVLKPEQGFAAYYIEMVYKSPLGFEYSLTTEMGLPE
ncbi:MAG TPA: PhoPQ-activated protein PqaA family protein [Candidatus Hydrogenedentes bacterium]|nr:PhoPQ-activated protein PqaA family protein [Candidatus Hydrogenedentota bacterium]